MIRINVTPVTAQAYAFEVTADNMAEIAAEIDATVEGGRIVVGIARRFNLSGAAVPGDYIVIHPEESGDVEILPADAFRRAFRVEPELDRDESTSAEAIATTIESEMQDVLGWALVMETATGISFLRSDDTSPGHATGLHAIAAAQSYKLA